MPPPLNPDPVLPGMLGPIFSPDPGQDVAIDFDADAGCARVVFYFKTNQTELSPGHDQGLEILAGILSGPETWGEFYGCADSTGTDEVNDRVVKYRLSAVERGLNKQGATVFSHWPWFNFGEQFTKDPVAVAKIKDAQPIGDRTDADFMRVVVAYAWPSTEAPFLSWLDEPHRIYGFEHPERRDIVLNVKG